MARQVLMQIGFRSVMSSWMSFYAMTAKQILISFVSAAITSPPNIDARSVLDQQFTVVIVLFLNTNIYLFIAYR